MLGLRNPFTFSVQPGTGLTYVNDVGETTWEEINDARAGRNFGWPTTEGCVQRRVVSAVHEPGVQLPAQRRNPDRLRHHRRSVLQPARLRPFQLCIIGKYFFADYCSGWIYSIDPAQPGDGDPVCGGDSGSG